MTELVLGNIPRVYTALADFLACLLYISLLPPRFKGPARWALLPVFLLVQSAFMILTGGLSVGWFLPCILASALLMLFFLHLFCHISWSRAGYFCARAFILGELAASLEWQLYYHLYHSGFTAPWGRPTVLALVYLVVFGLMLLLERRRNEETRVLPISRRELWSAVAIAAGAYLMSNLSYVYAATPFSGQFPAEIFNIRTLMDLGGVAILYAYHVQVSPCI